jgi:hypothetical protein
LIQINGFEIGRNAADQPALVAFAKISDRASGAPRPVIVATGLSAGVPQSASRREQIVAYCLSRLVDHPRLLLDYGHIGAADRRIGIDPNQRETGVGTWTHGSTAMTGAAARA